MSIIDEEWRVKKSKGSKNYPSYGRSKSPIHYKKNYKNLSSNKVKNSNRVVVKLYSSCKNKIGMSRHIDYMLSKADISITSDGSIIKNAYDIDYTKDRMLHENKDLESGKNKRETFNIIFSLRDYDLHNVSKDEYHTIMNECVIETIKNKYPNNFFVASLHSDTDNPHVHICLGKMDIEKQKKIDIRKFDLKELRYIFAEKLIEKGFKVRREINPYIKPKPEQFKTNDFEFVKAGKANYEFDPDSPASYFVQYRTNKDKELVTIWGKGLEAAVLSSGVQVGDKIKLKKESEYLAQGYAASWSISILEHSKGEKPLSKLFTEEEKADWGKTKGINMPEHQLMKSDKPLKTLFSHSEKEAIQQRKKGDDDFAI